MRKISKGVDEERFCYITLNDETAVFLGVHTDTFISNEKQNIVDSDRVIYTPSWFARSSLFYVQEVGTLRSLKPHRNMRRGLESFLFYVVLSGSGTFYYGDDEWSLVAGDCVFVDCRERHGHEAMQEDPWTLSWCHFNGESLPGIYDKYVERGGRPVFHPEEVTEFRQLLGDIFLLASGKDYIRDMRMNEKLGILLTKIMEYSWPEDEQLEKGKKSVLESVRGYLDEHFQERVLLDDLADQFFVNKYYLTRIFKEQYGVSISSYLQNLRISQAKKMLRFTDMPLEQIGAECGLGAGYYFSRVFKAVEGMAPSEYRKKW